MVSRIVPGACCCLIALLSTSLSGCASDKKDHTEDTSSTAPPSKKTTTPEPKSTGTTTTTKTKPVIPPNPKCGGGGGPAPAPAPTASKCKDLGCGADIHDDSCWCNPECKNHGSCCDDYDDVCKKEVSLSAFVGDAPIPWESSGEQVGSCGIDKPKDDWRLDNYCGSQSDVQTSKGFHVERFLSSSNSSLRGRAGLSDGDESKQLRVLSYNLFWFNLFGLGKGMNGAAGKNIAKYAKDQPFDLIGFQECEDVAWPLKDAKEAGMTDEFTTIVSDHNTAIAFRTAIFDKISQGGGDVAEDGKSQYYGTRGAYWVRLRHKPTGRMVFFMNHHGPTPINTGGQCGQEGLAYKLLKMVADNAKQGDAMILVGDFNTNWLVAAADGHFGAWYDEPAYIDCHFRHDFANPKIDDMWGLDNFYSACVDQVEGTVMDKGGSDHNALSYVYEL